MATGTTATDREINQNDTRLLRHRHIEADSALKRFIFSIAVPTLALMLTIPFALRGYHGDDSQFHFDSWIAMRQAWLAGNIAPGWDDLANYKLGDPRFCFYPPLSILLGAALCSVLPLQLAPAAFVWLALVLGACSMYVASRPVLGVRWAAPAALLYMLGPYTLLCAITRFAAAELLLLSLLPLIILQFLRASVDFNRRSILLLGGLLGLGWLANLPASIVQVYALLPTAGLVSIHKRSLKPLLTTLVAELAGILLAAFALLPAYFERKWITTSALLHQDFRDYFLFYSASGFHRLHFSLGLWTIGGVELALIVTAALILRGPSDPYRRTLLEMVAIAFLFALPITTVLWIYAPGLRFVQFPFRFLAIIGVILPMIALGENLSRTFSRAAFVTVAVLALLPLIFYLRINPSLPSTLPDVSLIQRIGHPGTEEYTPSAAATRISPIRLPALVAKGSPGSTCGASLIKPGRLQVAVSASGDCYVQLATYFYPYWEAIDESGNRLKTSSGESGILVVAAPPGTHRIQIIFRAVSGLRRFSRGLSLLTLLLLLVALSTDFRNRTQTENAVPSRSFEPVENEISVSASTMLATELQPRRGLGV